MKRNGKIELLRIIFCMCVVLLHTGYEIWDDAKIIFEHFTFFYNGRISVEFFFLLSGYLAAKSAQRTTDKSISIGQDTAIFISRKIKSLFLPHVIVAAITTVFMALYGGDFLRRFIDSLPSILFLQKTGISDYAFNSVEWYIGSMLLALAVIYPLLKKNFDFTSLVIAPVGSVMIIGYCVQEYSMMPPPATWNSFTYACNIRAIGVVLLGVFTYRVTEYIKGLNLTKAKKNTLIVIENLCWAISLLYIVLNCSRKYEGMIVLLMATALSIAFSRDFSNVKLYNSNLVYYLGRLSLPVYLSQNIMRDIIRNNLYFLSNAAKAIVIPVGTVIIGALIDLACIKIRQYNEKKKNNTANA